MGAFVDKVAGKLKRVDDATIQSMKLEPQLEMNYKDRRIILPKTEGEVLEPIKVLRADIDYNKHLNNARSASRRVTLARQELCPYGDGTVARGFNRKRLTGRISGCR